MRQIRHSEGRKEGWRGKRGVGCRAETSHTCLPLANLIEDPGITLGPHEHQNVEEISHGLYTKTHKGKKDNGHGEAGNKNNAKAMVMTRLELMAC